MTRTVDLECLSISDRLARLGFGHRSNGRTTNTGKRTVYRIADGEPVGDMTAREAAEFVDQQERRAT